MYFSGSFGGYEYDQTYIASTGVDIAVSAVSSYLDVLQDSLTPTSFGMLVDSDFSTIVISQEVVNRIYPKMTGNEETRVTYDPNSGEVVEDRRGVPYLPSDTIMQDLTKLSNANWTGLLQLVRAVQPGNRGHTKLNITLTGTEVPTEYHVLFHKWQSVANWTLLVFASVADVDRAINVSVNAGGISTNSISGDYSPQGSEGNVGNLISLSGVQGDVLRGQGSIVNTGNLDVSISIKKFPDWVQFSNSTIYQSTVSLPPGASWTVAFQVSTDGLIVARERAQEVHPTLHYVHDE